METKVISMLNYKGGVGKTTTTLHLGTALWLMGYKVLLVDVEQQCSLTLNLGFANDGKKPTLYEWMVGETDKAPVYNRYEGLDYIPSKHKMATVDIYLNNVRTKNHVLYRLLKTLDGQYDFILIDCAPYKGVLNDNVMVASDYVLIPSDSGDFAALGLDNLRVDIEEMVSDPYLNPDLKVLGVLRTKYNDRLNVCKRSTQMINHVFPGKVFDTSIHICSKVQGTASQRASLFEIEPGSSLTRDYISLAEEITGCEAKGWFGKANKAYDKWIAEYSNK